MPHNLPSLSAISGATDPRSVKIAWSACRADLFRHEFARVRAALTAQVPHFEIDWLMPGRAMTDPQAFRVATTALQFLHLRHTAVTRLAEAECEIPLIAAVTGHSPASVEQILTRYLVRTRRQATLAFDRRLAAETADAVLTGNAVKTER